MKYEITVNENGKEINRVETDSFFLIFDNKEEVNVVVELHDARVSDIASMIAATKEMIDNLLEEKPNVAFSILLSEA